MSVGASSGLCVGGLSACRRVRVPARDSAAVRVCVCRWGTSSSRSTFDGAVLMDAAVAEAPLADVPLAEPPVMGLVPAGQRASSTSLPVAMCSSGGNISSR